MLTDKSLRRLILQALYDKGVCTAEGLTRTFVDAEGGCSRMQLLTVIGTLLHCGYIVCGEHQTTYTIMPNGKYMLTKLKEAEQEAEQLTAAPPTEPVQMNYEYFIVVGANTEEVLYAGTDVSSAINDAEFEARTRKDNAVLYRAEVIGEAVISAKFIKF